MEYVGQQNIKKICNFYVSDVHLSVMLLPYISGQINGDVEITTIFEKIKKQEIDEIMKKLNVKVNNEKLNIKWFDSNEDENKKIEKAINESIINNKEVVIIIGGNQKYIINNNNKVIKLLKNMNKDVNIKIIDCYNVEEIGIDMKEIVKKYDGILNTLGEINTSEII